jgi:hypothetical protein
MKLREVKGSVPGSQAPTGAPAVVCLRILNCGIGWLVGGHFHQGCAYAVNMVQLPADSNKWWKMLGLAPVTE